LRGLEKKHREKKDKNKRGTKKNDEKKKRLCKRSKIITRYAQAIEKKNTRDFFFCFLSHPKNDREKINTKYTNIRVNIRVK
jgi:hypothetical protein